VSGPRVAWGLKTWGSRQGCRRSQGVGLSEAGKGAGASGVRNAFWGFRRSAVSGVLARLTVSRKRSGSEALGAPASLPAGFESSELGGMVCPTSPKVQGPCVIWRVSGALDPPVAWGLKTWGSRQGCRRSQGSEAMNSGLPKAGKGAGAPGVRNAFWGFRLSAVSGVLARLTVSRKRSDSEALGAPASLPAGFASSELGGMVCPTSPKVQGPCVIWRGSGALDPLVAWGLKTWGSRQGCRRSRGGEAMNSGLPKAGRDAGAPGVRNVFWGFRRSAVSGVVVRLTVSRKRSDSEALGAPASLPASGSPKPIVSILLERRQR